MLISFGFDIVYNCMQPTPMLLSLNVHASRAADLLTPDVLVTDPPAPRSAYHDIYGNWCTRLVAPAGPIKLSTRGLLKDSGALDPVHPYAHQHAVSDLPEEAITFLLGSRYCETDLLMETAWRLFGNAPLGWARVQAICDFVHNHIAFSYTDARATRTAFEAFKEKKGVCRDYAHLAVAFCRCMNIPARYCAGYLGDMGVPPPYGPMDFAGWFEAYLDGAWHTFDPRNNVPRLGRVLMARGRDATDVALTTSFGVNTLVSFKVYTDELISPTPAL